MRATRARVRPGVSTEELDRVGARVFADAGARSAPELAYGYPGVNCIEEALRQALTARAGTPINRIGRTVESVVTSRGYAVCLELAGHGIGRAIHGWPTVLNYRDPSFSEPLTAGLVITIEPIISAGTGAVREGEDGWTFRTADRACSAHVEHTLVITDDAPILISA